MINYGSIYYRYVYFCRVCALPILLNTVILLFNLVKNGSRLINGNSKTGNFVTTKWRVDLYTAKYGTYMYTEFEFKEGDRNGWFSD